MIYPYQAQGLRVRESQFGRQPAVAWQEPFFLRNNMCLDFGYVLVSTISEHEKDAQQDLEKNRTSMAP